MNFSVIIHAYENILRKGRIVGAYGKKWTKYFDAETISKLSYIGFKPSGLVEGSLVGNHRSPFHGFAIEFAGHRGYVPGDDPKHLDWKVYYKTGKYLLKQYEQETNFLSHILIDVSKSMNFEYKNGKKSDYAACIATALSQLIVDQSDSVGIQFFDRHILHEIPVSSSMEVVSKLAAFYENPPRDEKENGSIGSVLNLVAESCGRRHIVFIISDFFGDLDSTFDGMRRLVGNKHDVVLIHVVDPLEICFDIPGKIRFLEMEGSESMDAFGANIRDSYEVLFKEFLDDMKMRSMKLGIDYIRCNTARPFGVHLAEYLSAKAYR